MSQKMPFGHRGRMYSFLYTKICAFLIGKTPIAQLHSVWRYSVFYKTTMLCVILTRLLVCNTDLAHIIHLHVYFAALSYTSIFTRLTPGKLKEFCRSHADLSYSFSVYYSELRSSRVFSIRSSVIISKAPD